MTSTNSISTSSFSDHPRAATTAPAPQALSSIARTIVNVALGKQLLPESLIRFVPLATALGVVAAGVGYHYLHASHRRRRAQLAVFHIIRNLETDPNYAAIARDPTRLKEHAMDELNYMMEEALDWMEGVETFSMLKHRLNENIEQGLTNWEQPAKRQRQNPVEVAAAVTTSDSEDGQTSRSSRSVPGSYPEAEGHGDELEDSVDGTNSSSIAPTPSTPSDSEFDVPPLPSTPAQAADRKHQEEQDPLSSDYRPVAGGYGFDYRSDEELDGTSSDGARTSIGYRRVRGNAYGFRYSDEPSSSTQKIEPDADENELSESGETAEVPQRPQPPLTGSSGSIFDSSMLPVYRAHKRGLVARRAQHEAEAESQELEEEDDGLDELFEESTEERRGPIPEEEEEEGQGETEQASESQLYDLPVTLEELPLDYDPTSVEDALRPGGALAAGSWDRSPDRLLSFDLPSPRPASAARSFGNRSGKRAGTSSRSTGNALPVVAAAPPVSAAGPPKKRSGGRPSVKSAAPATPMAMRSSTRKTRYQGQFPK